ncbi:MAG: glycosyltransferase, partial [Flavobacteriaceae bacterium]|nr:glycosyltransferase [Flavobacteriaceae bacterium]
MLLETIIIIVYSSALLMIFAYALSQLNLLFNYLSSKKTEVSYELLDTSNPEEVPFVTIQLPVYNEKYVMEGLLSNIALMDYPKDRFEIQVLDDSTDESLATTAQQIKELQKTGLDIQHVLRVDRTGFKAGALKEGLKSAKGEFIAIFDADFLPKSDWLRSTIPHFTNPNIGVVQTRWSHLNRDFS